MTDQLGFSWDDEPTVWLVSTPAIPFVWGRVTEIMKAHPEWLLDGFYNLEELEAFLMGNQMDLWVAVDEDNDIEAVWLCRFEKWDQFSIYNINWGGGKVMPHAREAIARAEQYARTVLKADKIALDGRRGWLRVTESMGFEPAGVSLWKTLGREH